MAKPESYQYEFERLSELVTYRSDKATGDISFVSVFAEAVGDWPVSPFMPPDSAEGLLVKSIDDVEFPEFEQDGYRYEISGIHNYLEDEGLMSLQVATFLDGESAYLPDDIDAVKDRSDHNVADRIAKEVKRLKKLGEKPDLEEQRGSSLPSPFGDIITELVKDRLWDLDFSAAPQLGQFSDLDLLDMAQRSVFIETRILNLGKGKERAEYTVDATRMGSFICARTFALDIPEIKSAHTREVDADFLKAVYNSICDFYEKWVTV